MRHGIFWRRLALTGLLVLGATPAQAGDKLTVLLDWFVNPDHAPLIVAREKGYFAAQGLDVDLIAPADPNDPPKLVAAGKADIAVSYQPQLHVPGRSRLAVETHRHPGRHAAEQFGGAG